MHKQPITATCTTANIPRTWSQRHPVLAQIQMCPVWRTL